MYAKSEDGNIWNFSLFAMMLAAAIASFVAFVACRIMFGTKGKRLFIGVIASYLVMLILLVAASSVTGDIAETIMWMPIIFLFGIPYMAPLVGMSWLGSVLVIGNEKGKPEPVVSTRQPEGRS